MSHSASSLANILASGTFVTKTSDRTGPAWNTESGFIVKPQRGGGFQVNINLRDYARNDQGKIDKLTEGRKLLEAAGVVAELSLSRPAQGGGFTPWPCLMVAGASTDASAASVRLQLLERAIAAGASPEVLQALVGEAKAAPSEAAPAETTEEAF
jgi:hypothetical protein